MNKYIFTFGSGHLYAGFYQPICASDASIARAKMVELHGVKWSHQYSEDEWNSISESPSRLFTLERPLEVVYCEEK